MCAKKKSAVALALDSFINSVNRTGGSSAWLTSTVFLLGGALATYTGYTEHYLPTLIGGPLAVLIGLILLYKSVHRHKKRKKRHDWG